MNLGEYRWRTTVALQAESSRASSAAWRQQLKHRNCRFPSFEHTCYRCRIVVTRPRKSFPARRAAYKPGRRALRYSRVMANCTIQMALNKRSSEVLKENRESRRPIDKLEVVIHPVLLYVLIEKEKGTLQLGRYMGRMKNRIVTTILLNEKLRRK